MWSFIALVFFTVLIFYLVKTWLHLRAFPGPFLYSLTRFPMCYMFTSGRMDIRMLSLSEQYGQTVRMGPNYLMTSDPEQIKKMNAVRSSYVRSAQYSAMKLHPTRDNIVNVIDEEKHAKLRYQMGFGYSGKENLHLEADIDNRVLALVESLSKRYVDEKRPVELGRVITFFTLDVISAVAFGRSFGFIERDDDYYGYVHNIKTMLPAIMFGVAFPEVFYVSRLPFMQRFFPKATDATGLGAVMGFAKEVVAERFGSDRIVRKDMLGSFLSHGLSQEQLESETLIQIMAGSDSSAGAIRNIVFLLASNPRVVDKLLQELELAVREKRISRPVITDAEARELPYLQATIKEGLRCYPPAHAQIAKQVPPEGDMIDGKRVPGGVWVGWNAFGMMKRRDIFGDDVDVFRPERFLPEGERSDEAITRMADTIGLAFGYGRFGCLGKPVAMIELNKTIPELFLRFKLQISNPQHPFDYKACGFYIHTNMYFQISHRD